MVSLVAGSATLYGLTLDSPHQETIFAAVSIAMIGVIFLMERLIPMFSKWSKNEGDIFGDISSFVLVFGILDGALKWLAPFAILLILPAYQGAFNLPLAYELVIVFVVFEFTAWLSHWAHHRFPKLWALHAMHHSPKRLYSLNNFRFHPLNHIINHLLMMVPVYLLGLSSQAILGYIALTLPILLLQHSNLGFQFGMLDYIFNTNTVHRWHHSTKPSEGTKNLGRALVVFDQLFGTFYLPKTAETPAQIGLFASSSSYPAANRFFSQLKYPFSKHCCT